MVPVGPLLLPYIQLFTYWVCVAEIHKSHKMQLPAMFRFREFFFVAFSSTDSNVSELQIFGENKMFDVGNLRQRLTGEFPRSNG